MSVDRHADWFQTVRTHWHRTTGFVLASREPCLSIRADEPDAVRGRALVAVDDADLAAWDPGASWVLAALLCPGDTILPLLDWLRAGHRDPTRVWFYLHRSTDWEVLRPWEDAGLSLRQAASVASWQELRKLFGLALNDRVYKDWRD